MEQRRLRLGDILDDYCPRERRVTNHAVVAMIEDDVKQTRCTTCDAEHAYKGGKAPRKRKKETPGALYREVLAGMGDGEPAPALAPPAAAGEPAADEPPQPRAEATAEVSAAMDEEPADEPRDEEDFDAPPAAVEEGPVHRPLIRATLPRPEGQKEERRMPDFTVRHTGGRGPGNFRGGDIRGKQRAGGFGGNNGNRSHGGARFGGPRPAGSGRGHGRGGQQPSGFRSGQPQRHGGRKRSR